MYSQTDVFLAIGIELATAFLAWHLGHRRNNLSVEGILVFATVILNLYIYYGAGRIGFFYSVSYTVGFLTQAFYLVCMLGGLVYFFVITARLADQNKRKASAPMESDVEECSTRILKDGRIELTVIKGRLRGRTAIVIPTPPSAAYFNAER